MSVLLAKEEIEDVLADKFDALTGEFSGRTIRRLDIGIFPWHASIEISVLLEDDRCDPKDIAAWPHHNVSDLAEGKWPQAVDLCKRMMKMWEADPKSAHGLFQVI